MENASLMPWLAGTALLHSAIVVEKRDALKTWTILLAVLTFALSLMGTFLVRSGVLTSVHAFAVDPERGVAILLLLALATGGGLLLYTLRAASLKAGGLFAPISREGSLVLNNLLLSTACATVFLGTLYPLFLDTVGGSKISVGAPFFNTTFVPLMVPLVAAMAVGPMLAWKRADLPGALARLWVAAVLVVVCVLWALWAHGFRPVMALVGIGMAAWAFFGAFAELAERVRLFRIPLGDSLSRAAGLPRSAWGAAIAHAGLGISIAGMVGTSAWMSEDVRIMHPGDSASLAGYEFRLESVEPAQIANYAAQRGTVTVTRDGQAVATLHPEQRFYPVAKMTTTEAAIHTTFVSDIYVALGGKAEEGDGWTVRLYYHPLVPWIWFGAVVMVIGGLISLSDRRYRLGVPVRRASPAVGGRSAAQPAE
ncbi:cytochrome c-type biogenesis protein CcmF [Rhodospirillum centenum SW]|uniref:Cytochrome c-type biogenesis protein CcmF n=1 Tax=Rhodospirillum centenum (strain ATCC 51521 / SW) TaxID=414684 RepID=B6IVR3_RHOCS|nr:cytochrome c-type biogenesis protein CcmF [Rhodospirillum centenum SW]